KPTIDDLMRYKACERMALELHGATVRADEPGQKVEHGRLAGAVRSENPCDRARQQIKRHIVDGMEPAKILGQPPHLQRCFHVNTDRIRCHRGAIAPWGKKNRMMTSRRVETHNRYSLRPRRVSVSTLSKSAPPMGP